VRIVLSWRPGHAKVRGEVEEQDDAQAEPSSGANREPGDRPGWCIRASPAAASRSLTFIVRRSMNAQTQKSIIIGLRVIAIALCVADVAIFLWRPEVPAPSEIEQRQIRLAAAHRAGAVEAHQDIGEGILALKSAGLPAAWSKEYRQILRSRYNVERRYGLGCTGSEEEFASIGSYNRAMMAEIERLYGKGALQQAAKDAEIAFKKKHEIAEQIDSGNGR